MEALADALGVDEETLRDALSPAANLKRLAEAQGVSMQELRQVIAEASQEALQERQQRRAPVPTVRSRQMVQGRRLPASRVHPYPGRRLGVMMRPGRAVPHAYHGRGMGVHEMRGLPPIARWDSTGQLLVPRVVWEPVEIGISRPMIQRGTYPPSDAQEYRIFRRVPEASSESTQHPHTND